MRRYVHIGTGNYNPHTARIYTDLGLLSCSPGARRRPHASCSTSSPACPARPSTGGSSSRPHGLRARLLAMMRAGGGPCPGGPGGADRHQVQRHRGPRLGGGDLRGLAGRRARSTSSCGASARFGPASRAVRAHPGALDRRRVPRALPGVRLRQRRPPASGTSARPTSWSATSIAASRPSSRSRTLRRMARLGRDRAGYARGRSPVLAARRRRRLATDRGDQRASRGRSTRSRC